jgi:hypothetical protein
VNNVNRARLAVVIMHCMQLLLSDNLPVVGPFSRSSTSNNDPNVIIVFLHPSFTALQVPFARAWPRSVRPSKCQAFRYTAQPAAEAQVSSYVRPMTWFADIMCRIGKTGLLLNESRSGRGSKSG